MSTVVARRTAPYPADTFAERAMQLVAFLALGSREAGATMRLREEELARWIAQWRRAAPAAQHFVAVELGIILRALNGPFSTPMRLHGDDREQLCWVIARCMNHEA
jgi:hypothetical protein